ncbi:carotenoid ester lipase precursor [Roridomyces roridus]|uniref:Carboxylic ester hydrolase n=1 Tax=Roridomyces roridus TaxID=1738132 RepID=A0AAD7BUA3_9AGAR|nr:carotenoid ester lipase precursor [Roridomyces roridus]
MFPFLLSGALSILFCVAAEPIVSLPYGTFRGFDSGNSTRFLGVPFAQAGRFERPRTPGTLRGVQNATGFGPACPQQVLSSIPGGLADTAPVLTSEDCLTLDVYRPISTNARSKLPVFVWIYGGAFEIGSSRDNDMAPLVERSTLIGEPMIVVSINYRINAFGFLAGKEVDAAGVTNLGMRDQIFALEWVQQNVAAFGGDPARVVLGGVSAGSISVALLLLDNKKASNKLFRGAFMQSGSPLTSPSVVDGQADYDGLVAATGCSHARSTLGCLKQVPFESLMAAINETANVFSFSSLNIVWRPRVDGDVLVGDPLVSVAKGQFSKVPLLSGDSDDEGTMFTLPLLNITTSAEAMSYLHSNYLPTATASQMAQIERLYPDDPAQGSPFDTGTANQLSPQYKRLAAFQGDIMFIGPRRWFLEHASLTQNTWSWINKRFKTASELGSAHSSDGAIWFPSNSTTDFTAPDALINFINTLDPNVGSSRLFWPKWSTTGGRSLLTFSDPNVVNITAETFRTEAIGYLNQLLFAEASK